MATEHSWPRLRRLLDEACQTERGIAVTYPTWVIAERVRANMYKVRDMHRRQSKKTFPDPEDPRHGVSAYDGLSFWLRSSLSRQKMILTFASGETGEMEIPTSTSKKDEIPDLFPSERVTIQIGEARVENAPSYRHAWIALRADFPTQLIIENGYDITGLEIQTL